MKKEISVVLVPPAIIRGYQEPFEEAFSRRWPKASLEVLYTEEEFRERLQCFDQNPFDLAIFGVYIAFTSPRPGDLVVPQEVKDQGYHRRAGFRCRELLHAIAPGVPVVICDVFDVRGHGSVGDEVEKLPANSRYMRVEYDFEKDFFPVVEGLLAQ